MHYPHFRKELISFHAWRQTQTQSTIQNFYGEDMNIFHPRKNDRGDTDGIWRMEFPLMQWLVACLYKVFGPHLVITRLFMFGLGIGTTLGLYSLLQILFGKRILSFFGAWALNFSPSFFYYTINPLPDNMALCCSVWGMYFFFLWYNTRTAKHLLFCSLLLSAGALSKLPFILYFIVPAVGLLLAQRQKKPGYLSVSDFFLMCLPAILPLAWYAWVIPGWHGNPVVKGILGSPEPVSVWMHNVSHTILAMLPESLLNYGSLLLFLAGIFFMIARRAYKDDRFPLLASWGGACILYYLFEANAIGKVHDYYLFPFFPMLFMLVGYGAYYLFQSGYSAARYAVVVLLLILPLTCYLRLQNRWNENAPGFNKDLLIYKKDLQDAVPEDALVVAGNDVSHAIFFYYINKKGWGFDHDVLPPENLKDMISRGARYLYTDAEKIYTDPLMAIWFDHLILEKGTVRVYALKLPE